MTCLITVSIDALGARTGPTLDELLAERSPLTAVAPDRILAAVRDLERTTLTEDIRAATCSRLLIDPHSWPDPPPPTGFTVDAGAGIALALLAQSGPIAVVGALDCVTGPGHLAALTAALTTGRYAVPRELAGVHVSYELGAASPEPRWWHALAAAHHVSTEQIIHVGTDWVPDVVGPLCAGARVVHLHPWSGSGLDLPGPPDRAAQVSDLRAAADVIREWVS